MVDLNEKYLEDHTTQVLKSVGLDDHSFSVKDGNKIRINDTVVTSYKSFVSNTNALNAIKGEKECEYIKAKYHLHDISELNWHDYYEAVVIESENNNTDIEKLLCFFYI